MTRDPDSLDPKGPRLFLRLRTRCRTLAEGFAGISLWAGIPGAIEEVNACAPAA